MGLAAERIEGPVGEAAGLAVQIQELRGVPGRERDVRRLEQRLLRCVWPSIQGIARKLTGLGSLEYRDLDQVGGIAVLRFVGTFDAQRAGSQTFEQVAYRWVQRAMVDHLRLHASDVRLSDGAQRGRVKRMPTIDSVGTVSRDERLTVTPKDGQQDADFTGENWRNPEDEGTWDTPEQLLGDAQMARELRRAVNRLGGQKRELVCKVYGINRPAQSLRDVAREWGQPRSRLDAMLKAALDALRVVVDEAR